MAKIKWGKKATKDLKSIHEYISLDSRFYANQYISKIVLRVDQLQNFPESGRIVPEKEDPSIRELIEGNYRIFYKTQRGNVIILRIHHSSRKIK
ncbi:MAG: type II toxin-antitoxin system RelE/ParE family toxin [Saprospiraceae bacterium]|nr:type II toxin-antitoxin system RelE/ParE family toxin [Saprospiraceae bacterium]MBK7736146.1 type II toxin-antitoxin system RelE/ParE family toxin [Saprospiraceae bacterium]MBK7912490.1 type II toxin-antitoxin system RelE/ParE family toxin [Saprospiraceae bacterium]